VTPPPQGTPVERFTLTNARGTELTTITLGGIIVSLRVRDRAGTLADVVLGCDSLAGYGNNPAYLGAIVGRCANRIAYGRFILDGRLHRLTINDGSHHLHGGHRGFDKAVWQAETFEEARGSGVAFSHTSPHGTEGYPGTLTARVRYLLTADDRLIVDYEAATDAPTLVNLTQHSYFNLAGAGSGDILGHELMIAADAYTPVDVTLIPTGEIAAVAGTPFDFRTPTAIGARIGNSNPQFSAAGGYDHNFVLRRGTPGGEPVLAARVVEPTTGRTLEVFTTEPGLQFYSGNFLDGSITGKGSSAYGHRSGFCLETQGFPNAPNEPLFPSILLWPGAAYRSQTVYAFGVSAGRT
jgi:aldose 1-epimerase